MFYAYNSSPDVDDSPAITTAVNLCGSDSTIHFLPNITYNLLTPLNFKNLTNVNFYFQGNISLSENVTAVQEVVNNTRIYPGRWITIKGTNVTFEGTKDKTGGWFLAHGEKWWSNLMMLSRVVDRTGLVSRGLWIRNIKIHHPVGWVFSIGGSDVEMKNIYIDAKSSDGYPFNTDGIDLSGSNVLIDGLEIHNGDDVINISPPATNVTVRNVVASGTHGLSISCSSGTGSNYTFENAYIYDSLMATRFKGRLGKTCNISDVTWRNIEVKNAMEVARPTHAGILPRVNHQNIDLTTANGTAAGEVCTGLEGVEGMELPV
ncbi:hypothetical protein EYC84_011152 [Monilinia fructicola]|uniref:Glycoside hydrolase family 28 protein n=1 Tax=Monilinia fructicola TaxID=38448 RepID=A0A5M9J972_MONFR|nr:hypothetical protein EYC84_011152 [Monilinia fructicola]